MALIQIVSTQSWAYIDTQHRLPKSQQRQVHIWREDKQRTFCGVTRCGDEPRLMDEDDYKQNPLHCQNCIERLHGLRRAGVVK